jgi:hypothetical protein
MLPWPVLEAPSVAVAVQPVDDELTSVEVARLALVTPELLKPVGAVTPAVSVEVVANTILTHLTAEPVTGDVASPTLNV